MGLLDDVLGSVTGQRGASSTGIGSGGGMASMLMPILMAIMANKAGSGRAGGLGGMLGGGQGGLGGLLGGNAGGATGANGSGSGGLLGNLLGGNAGANASMPGGALGGVLGGGGLAGALGQLVSSFQQSGHGSAADSWVGHGANAPIGSQQVSDALGSDTLDQLSQHTGMPQDDIASQLSQWLPQIINKLTPNGRLPTSDEASKWT